MKPLINMNGITVKQLKDIIKELPETDENGNEYEIWVEDFDNSTLSRQATTIMQLNKGDIIIGFTS